MLNLTIPQAVWSLTVAFCNVLFAIALLWIAETETGE